MSLASLRRLALLFDLSAPARLARDRYAHFVIPIPIHNVPDETDGFFRLVRRVRSQ